MFIKSSLFLALLKNPCSLFSSSRNCHVLQMMNRKFIHSKFKVMLKTDQLKKQLWENTSVINPISSNINKKIFLRNKREAFLLFYQLSLILYYTESKMRMFSHFNVSKRRIMYLALLCLGPFSVVYNSVSYDQQYLRFDEVL